MPAMFEVYYKSPVDREREDKLTARLVALGGKLTFHEGPDAGITDSVVLTFVFSTWEAAEAAVDCLSAEGEHVEGPYEYPDEPELKR